MPSNICKTEFWVENALDKIDKGDFPSGIYGLCKAMESKPDLQIQIDLAQAYLDAGCIEEAKKYFARALAKDTRNTDAYMGLIACFVESGEQELVSFYYAKGIVENYFSQDEFEEYFFEETIEKSRIEFYDKNDKGSILSIASKLIASGDTEYAEQLLKSVCNPEVKQYKEICSLLALLYLNENRNDDADVYADKILAIDENDAFGLMCKTLVAYERNYEQELNEYKNRLLSIQITDEELLLKVAVCMKSINDAENAENYLKKLLAVQPYDRNILISAVFATGAQGKFDVAKRYVVTAHKLYPYDVEIKHFASLVYEKNSQKLREYMRNGFDGKQWREEIEKFMIGNSTLSKVESSLKKDEDMMEKITWLSQCEPCIQQLEVFPFLAQSNKWREWSQNMLLLPNFDLRAKKMILTNMLINCAKKDFSIFICGVFRRYKPKKLERSPLSDAYYIAYATLTFMDVGFDKDLYAAYTTLAEGEAKDIKDPQVAAAVMFYISGGAQVARTVKDCVEIFGVNEQEFRKFVYAAGLEKYYEFK